MYFTQYYLDCLSQASYLIGDERPAGRWSSTHSATSTSTCRRRRPRPDDRGVINTHFHADFLAGHLELAAAPAPGSATGAAPRPSTRSQARRRRADRLGDVAGDHGDPRPHAGVDQRPGLRARRRRVPYGVLTGDTLFIGDVGRPDLLASVGVTAEELGRCSTTRPAQADGPARRSGSSRPTARVGLRQEPVHRAQSTIGEQRATNYACQPMSEERVRRRRHRGPGGGPPLLRP